MNNPLLSIMGVVRSGGNYNQMIRNLAMRDPQIGQAMQMIQGKTPDQLKQMAMNMAKERGVSVEDVARGIGLM